LNPFRQSPLRLYDTLARRTEEVTRPDRVDPFRMYVCGPTVYADPHLGHGRFALTFDTLVRWLKAKGVKVRFVSNITDVDDKIIQRAFAENVPFTEVAARYEAAWWKEMEALGVLRPDHTPHATEFIEEMLAIVGELLARGHAYQTRDGIYFAVDSLPSYAELAHQDLEALKAGARVEPSPEKRSPLDFALWKLAKPGEPSWPSPWGRGRPGWHTECVAMSLAILGEGFDLHGGAQDLIFPHHVNEVAQAEALGREFARHWMHNGWVTVEGEKMSKSLGNFRLLADLRSRHDPRAFRLLVLMAHYRSPMEVTGQALADAERALERIDALARRFSISEAEGAEEVLWGTELGEEEGPCLERFSEAMDDDLDTPRAVAELFELVSLANRRADRDGLDAGRPVARLALALASVLGIRAEAGQDELPEAVLSLVRERERLRQARDFQRADALRNQIRELGYEVEDTLEGPRVFRR
jgi:cysteinyl-tRNA synthetase